MHIVFIQYSLVRPFVCVCVCHFVRLHCIAAVLAYILQAKDYDFIATTIKHDLDFTIAPARLVDTSPLLVDTVFPISGHHSLRYQTPVPL